MSRAITVDVGVFKKMAQKIQGTIIMIKKAGLPPIMDDYSMPRSGFSPISLDGPVPLSLTESLAMCGTGMFPLPESFTSKNKPKTVEFAETMNATETIVVPTAQKKTDNLRGAVNNHEVTIPTTTEEVNNEVSKEDDQLIVNVIMTSLKHNNMTAKAEENVASNVTRITLDDILAQNRVRIPEYAVLRRG